MRRLIFPLGLILFFLIPAEAQKLTRDEQEILWRQDQRIVDDTVLVRYLSHKESRIRKQAAMALANIQDSTTIPFLLPLLHDRYSSVRSAAAFALGQIGSALPEGDLAERLRQETNADVIARLLESLGKTGSVDSYDDVVAFGLPRKLSGLKADIAMSVARFALRNIKSDRGVVLCFDLLEEEDTRVQWNALYALWRMAPLPAIDDEITKRKARLKKLAVDRAADVRMHLATLLGKTKSPDAEELLQTIHQAESRKGMSDWRVQVNLLRSLAAVFPRSDRALKSLMSFLHSGNEHVLIASITAVGGLPREAVRKSSEAENLRKRLEQLARPSSRRAEIIRGEAIVAIARLYPADFAYRTLLEDGKSSNFLRSKVVEAMCMIPSGENLELVLSHLEDDSLRVAMAAWDFIRKLLAPQSFRIVLKDTSVTRGLGARLFRKAKVSLLREDMAITTLVAMALGDSTVFSFLSLEGYAERVVEELMLAYGKLSSPGDVEPMHAILETLGKSGDIRAIPVLERALGDRDRTVALVAASALQKITGQDYGLAVPSSSKPIFTDYDWKTLETIPQKQTVEIRTSKGAIELRLRKSDAPFTVLSFYKLVRKKFYNGLTFHRVIPNFVIQGGDPRGDGWGGPNYAIRSEFSLLTFGRGEVGIASAGKDTEGCQFFITHSPQPHLDGRYTIFAAVLSGMDVVDKIQIGDKILSIRLKR